MGDRMSIKNMMTDWHLRVFGGAFLIVYNFKIRI